MEAKCNPDETWDITKLPYPYEENSVDVITMFHAIEHIQKAKHPGLLQEFHKILKPEGKLIISYPEFEKCFWNWQHNYQGHAEFWEQTIFGLQRYPSDYHVCIMQSTPEFKDKLREAGFDKITFEGEPGRDYNTVCRCVKGEPQMTYEDVLRQELFSNR